MAAICTFHEFRLEAGKLRSFEENPARTVLIIAPLGTAGVEFGLGTDPLTYHGMPIANGAPYDFSGAPPGNAFWIRAGVDGAILVIEG